MNINKKKLLILFVTLLLLVLVILIFKNNSKLTYNEMIEDMDFFFSTIEKNYPFIEVLKRQNIYLDDIHNTYKKAITKDTTEIEFIRLMQSMVGQFRNIGHMELIADKERFLHLANISQIYYPNYSHKIFNNKTSMNRYSFLFDYGSAKEMIEDINVHNIQSAEIYEKSSRQNIDLKVLEDDKIAYIKIKSFNNNYIDLDKVSLEKFYIEIKNYENLIIDLRHNSGGSTYYYEENIFSFLLNEPVEVKNISFLSDSKYILDYLETDHNIKREELKYTKNLDLSNYPKISKEDLLSLDFYIENQKILENQNSIGFKGDIWILVDGKVYSASENFVMISKENNIGTIIGVNTDGDGGGVTPLIFAMPNSGLIWRNSILYTINPDGSNNEEYGTMPDYEIMGAEDALEVCLKLIEK